MNPPKDKERPQCITYGFIFRLGCRGLSIPDRLLLVLGPALTERAGEIVLQHKPHKIARKDGLEYD